MHESHFTQYINASIFNVVAICDNAYVITLLENNTDRWTADTIAKKKIEEYGFRPIVEDNASRDSGDNGISGSGGEEHNNDNKIVTKNMECRNVDSN